MAILSLYQMGVQLSWESTCLARRGSGVRSSSSPPKVRDKELNDKPKSFSKWAHSSGGQSARLISVRSVVRVHLCPPRYDVAKKLGNKWTCPHCASSKRQCLQQTTMFNGLRSKSMTAVIEVKLVNEKNSFLRSKIYDGSHKRILVCVLRTHQNLEN